MAEFRKTDNYNSAADRLAEAEAEAEKRRRRGWNSVDGVTIELSARERKLCGID